MRLKDEVDFRPTSLCDGYLDLRSLTPALLEEIEGLAPFGMGNPNPKFIFADVMVESYTLIQDKHIRCRFSQGDGITVEGIGFNLKDTPFGNALMEGKKRPLHLLASPKVDTWGGKTKITLMVEDAVVASWQLQKAV
jgi:single-stranded-DNA-specific exonuclease